MPPGLEMLRRFTESLAVDDDEQRREWAARLPMLVAGVSDRWRLTLGRPFQPGGTGSWVAARPLRRRPGARAQGGSAARRERARARGPRGPGRSRHRAGGAVEKDDDSAYLLLERCAEDRMLADEPEEQQDEVVAGLLRRLWVEAPPGHPFRPLAQMCAQWVDEYEARPQRPPLDHGLARAGAEPFCSLPGTETEQRLWLTDLHAGNVLAAEREPWLVIDPKPYVGDPAYDPVQHLLNCLDRLRADPVAVSDRMADLCGADLERLRRAVRPLCSRLAVVRRRGGVAALAPWGGRPEWSNFG